MAVTVTPGRMHHILDGDVTGGGHRHGSGIPGKTKFPAGWSDATIERVIVELANDLSCARSVQPNGKLRVEGGRQGVRIRVIIDPLDNTVVTAHPW